MMNDPTNSATPAKTSRKMVMKDRTVLQRGRLVVGLLRGGLHLVLAAEGGGDGVTHPRVGPAVGRQHVDAGQPVAGTEQRLRVPRSKAVSDAPARPPLSPKVNTPTTSAWIRGPGVSSVTRSPTS